MTAPLTTISYRIQSVDFLTYIERPSDSSYTEMRPFKDSTRQQWKFVDAGSNSYYIQNVKLPNECLGYTTVNGVYRVDGKTQSSAVKWTVNWDGDSYFIKYLDNVAYRFQTDATSQVKMMNVTTGYDNERWKLLPVTSPPIENKPLASGYYRIRSFNGLYLMTMPSGDSSTEDASVFIKSQGHPDLYQRWLVTRQTDGLYVILSSGNSSYMGCGDGRDAQGDYVSSVATPYEWCIQSTGLPSSFSISLPSSQLSLGFGNYSVESDQDVSLVISDGIPSQLWFFEKYIPPANEQVHGKRWPAIGAGKYQLRNCNDPTIYITYFGSPGRIQKGSATGKSQFSLAYEPNSPQFTLTYDETTKDSTIKHPVADVAGYLNVSTAATDWVLLKEDDDDPGYYICRPDAGYPRRVISSRLFTAADTNTYFAIDDMTKGETMQMWSLLSA